MPLAAITQALRRQAATEAEAIREQGRRRAEAEAEEALSRGEREAAAARAAAQAPADRECALALYRARIEASRARGEATRWLVQEALTRATSTLERVRSREDYPELLRYLLAETIAELHGPPGGGVPPLIQADARDRALVEKALADLGKPAYVDFGLVCWGGVNGHSADGLVTVENTVEARLRNAGPTIERYLAAAFEASDPLAALHELGRQGLRPAYAEVPA